MSELKRIQGLVDPLTKVKEKRPGVVYVWFFANLEYYQHSNSAVGLTVDTRDKTVFFRDPGAVYSTSNTPLEFCEVYARIGEFLKSLPDYSSLGSRRTIPYIPQLRDPKS